MLIESDRNEFIIWTGDILVNGGWSPWSISAPCDVTCGSGIERYNRSCTDPSPEHGGLDCQPDIDLNEEEKVVTCDLSACPGVK